MGLFVTLMKRDVSTSYPLNRYLRIQSIVHRYCTYLGTKLPLHTLRIDCATILVPDYDCLLSHLTVRYLTKAITLLGSRITSTIAIRAIPPSEQSPHPSSIARCWPFIAICNMNYITRSTSMNDSRVDHDSSNSSLVRILLFLTRQGLNPSIIRLYVSFVR